MKGWFVFFIGGFKVGVLAQTYSEAIKMLKNEYGDVRDLKFLGIYFDSINEKDPIQKDIKPSILV